MLKVIDRLSPSMLVGPSSMLKITEISKLEAQDMVRREDGARLMRPVPYNSDRISQALGLPFVPRPKLEPGERLIFVEIVDYKTQNFFLVEYLKEGTHGNRTERSDSDEPSSGPDPFEQ